jgi:hypothetical protein
LPADTLSFCEQALATHGIDLASLQGSTITNVGSRLHKEAYILLREMAKIHFAEKRLPVLKMCPHIIGGAAEAQNSNSRLGQLIHENYHAAFVAEPVSDLHVEEMVIAEEDSGWIEHESEELNN